MLTKTPNAFNSSEEEKWQTSWTFWPNVNLPILKCLLKNANQLVIKTGSQSVGGCPSPARGECLLIEDWRRPHVSWKINELLTSISCFPKSQFFPWIRRLYDFTCPHRETAASVVLEVKLCLPLSQGPTGSVVWLSLQMLAVISYGKQAFPGWKAPYRCSLKTSQMEHSYKYKQETSWSILIFKKSSWDV